MNELENGQNIVKNLQEASEACSQIDQSIRNYAINIIQQYQETFGKVGLEEQYERLLLQVKHNPILALHHIRISVNDLKNKKIKVDRTPPSLDLFLH